MIHEIAGRQVYIGIPSAYRPQNAATHPIVEATWHVPLDKFDEYWAHGAVHLARGSDVRAGHAANTILDAGQALDADVLIIEDDPVNVKLAQDGKAVHIDPMDALDMLVRLTLENKASVGITAKEFNAYWKKGGPDVARHGHVAGWVVYVPYGPARHLRHDESLLLGGQDFDFVVQHIAYGLGFIRAENIMWKFKMGDKGSFSERVEEQRREMDNQLMAKWADTGIVRTNPRTGWIHIPRQK